jgi:serine/threonine protein kinase
VEVTPSQFAHEAQGLNLVRAVLPAHAPFRAWSNFEFRDSQGRWGEVDLLVLGRRRLHLVELKYYSGTLRGDDLAWLREGRRAEDSPLKLARRKAQRLASKLRDELSRWAQETHTRIPDPYKVIPFVQECVFLHHPDLRCALSASSRIDLFGLDGHESDHGLPGISQRLLEPPSPQHAHGVSDETVAALLARIGLVQRRQREIGSWVIDEQPLGEGEGWQEWPAFHRVATTNRARIRFLVTPAGATRQEQARTRRIAEHEYRTMSRLAHEALLAPKDLVDGDLGVGLVYAQDERFQRLDLWLADHADGVPVADQLSVLRQVAEAVGYAHGNKVVHRGLTPHAVLVRALPDGGVRVVVGDWQSAGTIRIQGMTNASSGVTGLLGALAAEPSGPAALRLGRILHPGAVDVDRRMAEAFQAPEEVYSRDADRIRLDVFALGALAYYILAGRPAASDRAGLRERLHRDGGLDLAADLPQVPSAVRTLVLEATRPSVSDRMPDIRRFLEQLAAAERALTSTADEEVADPLDAAPGAILGGGRFRLERRLGSGSTAVGLLVTDLATGSDRADTVRVLKVAVDDAAASRLAGEAEVLRRLSDPRLVRMIEGPLDIGPRTALLLESAGKQTLADLLRNRSRVSLDLLERWGSDLLEALAALDRAGVDHRDIKPSNLGIREGRGRQDRVKHLVLFDFSLARAGATALTAGTPDYLDPFLGTHGRDRYDSAAERYSAAVVLFEMATGTLPRYGDGQSDPAAVPDEASVEPGMFDPTVAPALVGFFTTALARAADARHHTAAEMLAAWRSAFAPVPRTQPDDADQLAAAAGPSTPLTKAGLSARALSAVELLGVTTVGDLVAVDAVRLNRLSGAAEATRREVKDRARQWRERFGAAVTGRGRRTVTATVDESLPDPFTAAELLVDTAGPARAGARRAVARLLLGLDHGLDPFATQAELATALQVGRGRPAKKLAALQDAWATNATARGLLDAVWGIARRSLSDLGGVATIGELAESILATLPPGEPGEPAPGQAAPDQTRVAAGLLRLALDRAQALSRADAEPPPVSTRRRDQRLALVASDPAMLDPAEAIGRTADLLVAQTARSDEPVVPASRVRARLREAWQRAGGDEIPELAGDRLPRLAVALSSTAALSGAGELHHRDLDAAQALALALAGAAQPVSAQEVRDRVRARFPGLPPLPDRPRLDELVEQARLGLVYDDGSRAFRPRTRIADTSELASRPQTHVVPLAPALVAGGHHGHRLAESTTSRSFLALGVDALQADKAVTALTERFGAQVFDLTSVLIGSMKEQAAVFGLSWDDVRAADAATPGSREAHGLAALVRRAWPTVETALSSAVGIEGAAPLLLTEAAPLARYDHLGMLSRWSDLTTRRGRAVWLLVPQLLGNNGAVIDGRPLPLAAPGQFLRLNTDWINGGGGATRVPAT